MLLAGDVFHENKPSRAVLHRTLSLLREYTMGDRPVSVELLSDPYSDSGTFPSVNYEDENLNVSIPVFSIHGNHDDPQGLATSGVLSALDLLSVAGLINYFGRVDLPSDAESSARKKRNADGDASTALTLKPILLRKGNTNVALYGLGNVKDERLRHELETGHVRMYRPIEEPDSWFSVLAVHQNRSSHTPNGYIPESAFDDSVNLVVWGHEHEQRIVPEPVAEKNYHISQPGSTIATSLSPAEAVDKCVAILHIDRKDFLVEPVALKTVRPFVTRSILLSDEAKRSGTDLHDRISVQKLLRRLVRDT